MTSFLRDQDALSLDYLDLLDQCVSLEYTVLTEQACTGAGVSRATEGN